MPEAPLTSRDRRVVLQQLSRDRLAELTKAFELDVEDRRSSDSHVDAIIRKRSLDFTRLLELLRRDELQAACDALGFDSGGREKTKLVERILSNGTTAATPSSASSTPPPMSAQNTGTLK